MTCLVKTVLIMKLLLIENGYLNISFGSYLIVKRWFFLFEALLPRGHESGGLTHTRKQKKINSSFEDKQVCIQLIRFFVLTFLNFSLLHQDFD